MNASAGDQMATQKTVADIRVRWGGKGSPVYKGRYRRAVVRAWFEQDGRTFPLCDVRMTGDPVGGIRGKSGG